MYDNQIKGLLSVLPVIIFSWSSNFTSVSIYSEQERLEVKKFKRRLLLSSAIIFIIYSIYSGLLYSLLGNDIRSFSLPSFTAEDLNCDSNQLIVLQLLIVLSITSIVIRLRLTTESLLVWSGLGNFSSDFYSRLFLIGQFAILNAIAIALIEFRVPLFNLIILTSTIAGLPMNIILPLCMKLGHLRRKGEMELVKVYGLLVLLSVALMVGVVAVAIDLVFVK